MLTRIQHFHFFQSDDEWFPGTVTAAIAAEGTYDILYDDGDTDEGLSDNCIRRLWEDL